MKNPTRMEPEYDLAGLVGDMMASDLKLFRKEKELLHNGHSVYKQSE